MEREDFMSGAKNRLPRAVVRRFIKYLRLVEQKQRKSVEWISSREIADSLELTSSTVRQDLSHLNFSGTPKYGYQTSALQDVLRAFLKADENHELILVGAGNLGKAIAQHQQFARQGYTITAIFDKDPSVIGQQIGGVVVEDIANVNKKIAQNGWKIAVLAVPGAAAQEVADKLTAAGMKGFLNLSLAHIIAPQHVAVVDARLIASLQELAFAINEREMAENGDGE